MDAILCHGHARQTPQVDRHAAIARELAVGEPGRIS
jgi:hypothetical protein